MQEFYDMTACTVRVDPESTIRESSGDSLLISEENRLVEGMLLWDITKRRYRRCLWCRFPHIFPYEHHDMSPRTFLVHAECPVTVTSGAAKEAMEQSGIVGTIDGERMGVCFGSGFPAKHHRKRIASPLVQVLSIPKVPSL